MQAIASALEEQEAIPAIKAQMVLIQAVAGDEWWEDVTIAMLEAARKKLRALVKLIEKGKKNIVFTDFEDELGAGTLIALPGISTGMNLAKFKDKARQFLRAHESHLSLQRLRRKPFHASHACGQKELQKVCSCSVRLSLQCLQKPTQFITRKVALSLVVFHMHADSTYRVLFQLAPHNRQVQGSLEKGKNSVA
jgi:type I site-specific restriction endonuclease